MVCFIPRSTLSCRNYGSYYVRVRLKFGVIGCREPTVESLAQGIIRQSIRSIVESTGERVKLKTVTEQ